MSTPRTKATRLPLPLSTTLLAGACALAAAIAALSQNACTPSPDSSARAMRVTNRAQLIGGPNALGEVGDYLLENDQIRVIIQDQGFSRGFGVFGGSLIDADLVRPGSGAGDSSGGVGKDNFGEMFPAFFLEALAPSEVFDPNDPTGQKKLPAIEITNDGKDGGAAEVTVRGYGGDFLAMTQTLNEFILDDPREAPNLLFSTTYRLAPGKRYVEIETTVQNVAFPVRRITLPNDFAGITVPAPFGDVLLFGAGNHVFLPHDAGYDLRYRLESVYQSGEIELPALPGLVAEYIASSGPDVSYGLLAAEPEDPEKNFAYKNRDVFPNATGHSVHVPFIASAFTGVFQVNPPSELAGNDATAGGDDEYRFTRYFIVGSGDVASVTEVVHQILGDDTGRYEGRLRDEVTGAPVADASIILLDEDGAKVTQATSDDDGRFRARVRPGRYQAVVVKEGHAITAPVELTVEKDRLTFQDLWLPGAATVTVTVVEPNVGPVPAKVTLVGTAALELAGRDPKEWLFDLSLGEDFRYTDLEPDTDDPATRRFIEGFAYTHEGTATLTARPGKYTVVVSRGPEYERVEIPDVELKAGAQRSVRAELRRVVNTEGYVAADFHLHSVYSLDSFAPLDQRITSYVGEGLELVVSTDHNFVVDYAPTIAELGLERFVRSLVGLELTTIDRGHFNGFPIRSNGGALRGDGKGEYTNTIASRTFGSFQWAERAPQELFDELRALVPRDEACLKEKPDDAEACDPLVEKVIVQVNHPRDSILGYFDQYVVEQETLRARGQSGLVGANVEQHPEFAGANFSWDFDALEVFNGKRFEMLHNFRVPAGLPVNPDVGAPLDPVSCCPLTPGAVYREYPEFDCDEELRDCTCTAADANAQVLAGNCDDDGEILHPGVVEDWLQILRTGRRVVGTANSDSHEPNKEEPGYPRTYVRVPNDQPRNVTAQDVVDGFLAGDVLMTNGPFVTVSVTNEDGERAGMGDTANAAGGELTLDVVVRHAPWVVPSRVVVYLDGQILHDEPLEASGDGVIEATFPITPTRDGFVVVEVSGEENMFPSVFPNEVPSLQFTDVIGALGDSFGFLASDALRPDLTFQVTPYALTNPVWIDANGDGEVIPDLQIPPPPPEARMAAGVTTETQPGVFVPGDPPLADVRSPIERWKDELPARKRRALSQRLPEWLWPTDHPKDIRRVWAQFAKHAH